jgi:hypothetical protein
LKGGTCHECRCSVDEHYHARQRIVKRRRKVTDVIFDLHTSKTAHTNLNFLQQGKKVLKKSLIDLYQKIETHCRDLKQTCAEINLVNELYQFVHYLEKDCENMSQTSAKEEIKQFVQNLKSLEAELSGEQEQGEPINKHEQTPSKIMREEMNTATNENSVTDS